MQGLPPGATHRGPSSKQACRPRYPRESAHCRFRLRSFAGRCPLSCSRLARTPQLRTPRTSLPLPRGKAAYLLPSISRRSVGPVAPAAQARGSRRRSLGPRMQPPRHISDRQTFPVVRHRAHELRSNQNKGNGEAHDYAPQAVGDPMRNRTPRPTTGPMVAPLVPIRPLRVGPDGGLLLRGACAPDRCAPARQMSQ